MCVCHCHCHFERKKKVKYITQPNLDTFEMKRKKNEPIRQKSVRCAMHVEKEFGENQ